MTSNPAGMGSNFLPRTSGNNSNSMSMIASQTMNTAPAPSNMDSHLMDLLRRSQKAVPNSAAGNSNGLMMNFASAVPQPQQQGSGMNAAGFSGNPNLNSSLDYSTALAAAVAAGRNPSLFQGQGHLGQGTMTSDAVGNQDAMFLLQQQQQQQQQQLARLNAVDGGNMFLQERLGMSSNNSMNTAGLQSSMMNSSGLSSPTLQGFSNPASMDLAQVFMASQQQPQGANAFASNPASSFGTFPPAPSQDASELSRMIMMLRGQGNLNSGLGGAGGVSNTNATPSFVGSASSPNKAPAVEKKRPAEASLPKKKRAVKKAKVQKPPKAAKIPGEITITPRKMPCVLYTEDDDDYLTPYQCLLRKQLEIFVADAEDVRCSSQQGRTTNIKVGQVGLRCRHCEGGLASRTKGAVYYSHSVEGIYQVGQNIGKVHLAERCYRIPDDIRRQLIALRNDSRRASSGKAYWSDRIRALGVYAEGKVLKLRTPAEAEAAKQEAKNAETEAPAKKEGAKTLNTTMSDDHATKASPCASVARQE